MTPQPIYLLDQSSARVAVLKVTLTGDLYSGTIGLEELPPPLRLLFQQFEEMVEGQVFSLADEIEEKIHAVPLRVVFSDGLEAPVEDLQVYPSTKRVSFKVRQVPTVVPVENGHEQRAAPQPAPPVSRGSD